MSSGNQHDDGPGSQNRCHPHCERPGNHLFDAAKFSGGVSSGDGVQIDETSRKPERLLDAQVAWLIERDVAVAADAQKLNIQPAIALDPSS